MAHILSFVILVLFDEEITLVIIIVLGFPQKKLKHFYAAMTIIICNHTLSNSMIQIKVYSSTYTLKERYEN